MLKSSGNTFLRRLDERGIEVTAEQFSAVTEPLAKIYAIPDHLHALCNMLGDGLVPSNAKAGYLARMLARRTLRLRDELNLDVSLADLARHHIEVNLGSAAMKQTHDGLLGILALEENALRRDAKERWQRHQHATQKCAKRSKRAFQMRPCST